MDILGIFTQSSQPAQTGSRGRMRDNASLYSHPLPLEVYPLPAFIPSNPLSYLRIAFCFLAPYITYSSSHSATVRGYYSPKTRSVNVTGDEAIHILWRQGFFGKGSLSRSEPEWLARERRRKSFANNDARSIRGVNTATEVTNKRRQERREEKRLRAQRERAELEEQLRIEGKLVDASPDANVAHASNIQSLQSPSLLANDTSQGETSERGVVASSPMENASGPRAQTSLGTTDTQANQEHLQLTPQEAFFLAYGLGVLEVYTDPPSRGERLSTQDLLNIFRRTSAFPSIPKQPSNVSPDDSFLVQYAAYHHYRSLGWVVRPGIKFAVDFLLYARGPVFSHAEFAVIVLPVHSKSTPGGRGCETEASAQWRERGEWWYLHSANRVQNQVLKTLVVAYVEVPPPSSWTAAQRTGEDISELLKQYTIREFVIRRWTANRNRG